MAATVPTVDGSVAGVLPTPRMRWASNGVPGGGSSTCTPARASAALISARKADEAETKTYLHRGIATRAFERRFALADHVKVTGAATADGMLHIDLVREVPEALKPRRIEIAKGETVEAKAVETVEA